MGRLFVKIASIFAELERDTIRERTAASRQALRAAGRWGGEAVHYGYKAAPRDRQRSLRGQDLKGDRRSESTIWDILQSKALLGWTTHNGEADPNNLKSPPIITSELFERVQIELSKRKRAKTRNPARIPLHYLASHYAGNALNYSDIGGRP